MYLCKLQQDLYNKKINITKKKKLVNNNKEKK